MTEQIATLLDKVPPQNLEAEQSTLGSMMIDRNALDKGVDILKGDDFYRDAHRIIFDALVSLSERNEPVDIVTTQEELRARKRLEDVGGTEYLMALIDAVPSAANIEYYAHIVEEKAILRRLIDACTQGIAMTHNPPEDVKELVGEIERIVSAADTHRSGKTITGINVLSNAALDQIGECYKTKSGVTGLRTGFTRLDEMLAGLQPSDLIIVGARPSMGKTALVCDIARHAALHEDARVLMFSIEMSKEQLAFRLLCSEAKVDAHRLRTGYVADREWPIIADATGRLQTDRIQIDDRTGLRPMDVLATCRQVRRDMGLDLVIVDYLQLMEPNRSRASASTHDDITTIARALKSIAREMSVPVIALSQLSREVEKRPDKRPMLSDLRDSGSIEAEADVVMMLYREAYYRRKADPDAPVMEADNVAEVIVGKQRNGPTGTARLAFLPKYACFENLDESRESEE